MYILENSIANNSIFDFYEWIKKSNSEGSAILIDKEEKWTSFDVVAKLRNLTKIKKIGHCGTLDPFATGLLILCLGKYTKQINTFQELNKKYLATIKLGATTKSFDIETEEENIVNVEQITNEQIINTINTFVGKIEQIPPMFSAKKVNGRKLYELARKNIEIELKPVWVEIFSIKMINIETPFATILIECSKGTYIRALARDIGNSLGVGGYLTQLRRTAIGNYSVENAIKIQNLIQLNKNKPNE